MLRETTKAWVNENGNPVWLKDGSFLWFSERSGFKHLYHYRADGTLLRPGDERPVGSAHAVRRRRGARAPSTSRRRSAARIDTDIYRVALDGSGLTRLSQPAGYAPRHLQPGVHATTSTSGATSTTPTQVRLHRADGTEVRVLDANAVRTAREYRLSHTGVRRR